MTPRHHATEEILLSHVIGAMSVPMDVAVASHLALCSSCRELVADLTVVGGQLLEELPDTPEDPAGLAAVRRRIKESGPEATPPSTVLEDPEAIRVLPAPLQALAGKPLAQLPWRRVLPGVSVADITSLAVHGAKGRLVRVRAGGRIPRHWHESTELIVVLSGGTDDSHHHYRRGDMMISEKDDKHRLIMDDDEDCLCYGVTDGRTKFTGPVSRVLQVVMGY